jgi:hypothetical protein
MKPARSNRWRVSALAAARPIARAAGSLSDQRAASASASMPASPVTAPLPFLPANPADPASPASPASVPSSSR